MNNLNVHEQKKTKLFKIQNSWKLEKSSAVPFVGPNSVSMVPSLIKFVSLSYLFLLRVA